MSRRAKPAALIRIKQIPPQAAGNGAERGLYREAAHNLMWIKGHDGQARYVVQVD